MDCSMSGCPVLHHLPKLAQTQVHWVNDSSNHFILSSPSPPAFNFFQDQGLFQWASRPIRWPKYWSYSFSISSSIEYSGLISFRIDWFGILAVQGTLKSSQTPQFKSINSSVSALFMVQLSCLYMTTGKTIALKMQTCVRKVTRELT